MSLLRKYIESKRGDVEAKDTKKSLIKFLLSGHKKPLKLDIDLNLFCIVVFESFENYSLSGLSKIVWHTFDLQNMFG